MAVEEGSQLPKNIELLRQRQLDTASRLLGVAIEQSSSDIERAIVAASGAVDSLRRILVLDGLLQTVNLSQLSPDDESSLTRVLANSPHSISSKARVAPHRDLPARAETPHPELELTFPRQFNLSRNSYRLVGETGRLLYPTREDLRDRTYEFVRNRHQGALTWLKEGERFFEEDLKAMEAKMRAGYLLAPEERPYRLGNLFGVLGTKFPFNEMSLDENIGLMYRRAESLAVFEGKRSAGPTRVFPVTQIRTTEGNGHAEIEQTRVTEVVTASELAGNGHVGNGVLVEVVAVESEAEETTAAVLGVKGNGAGTLEVERTGVETPVASSSSSNVNEVRLPGGSESLPRSMQVALLLTPDEMLEYSSDDLEITDAEAFIGSNLVLAQERFADLPKIVDKMTQADWKTLKRLSKNLNGMAREIIANPALARPTHARFKFITLDSEGARQANHRELGRMLVRIFDGVDDYTLDKLFAGGINIKT